MTGFVKIAIDDIYSDNNWTTIINKYWMLAERVSDPRVQGWFLFDTPIPTLIMVMLYLAFILVVGPMWMANRKPFKIKGVLVGYNAAQVLLSSYMFYEHLMSGWWDDYSLTCQPVDYSNSEKARRMLHLCWVYYFSKLSEFADTVFFVLRKKRSQITWLHLYHHSLTPFEAWMLVKFIAGGHGTFSNIVNNLVHVIMYGYYMLAAMGPQYQKYLWWKKHLTTMQLIQFFMVLFHSISALVYDCGYPKIIASGLILHSSIFICLFMNFYMHAYKPEIPKQRVDSFNNNTNDFIPSEHIKVNGHTNGHIKPDNGFNGHPRHSNASTDHDRPKNALNCDFRPTSALNGCISPDKDLNRHIRPNSALNGHIKTDIVLNGHVKTDNIANGHKIVEGNISEKRNGYVNGHIPVKEKLQ